MTAPARALPVPEALPQLRVLPGRRARPAPRLRYWVILTVVVLSAFFLLIYSRIALDDSAFILQEIDRQSVLEERRYWDLRLESARLQAPERIVVRAQELGMVYPDDVRTLEVPGIGSASAPEERWTELKAVLGAQP